MKFIDKKRYQKLRTDLSNKLRSNPDSAYMLIPETYGISDQSDEFGVVIKSWDLNWKFLVLTVVEDKPGIIVFIGLTVNAIAERVYKFIEDARHQGADQEVIAPLEEAAREFIRQSGAE